MAYLSSIVQGATHAPAGVHYLPIATTLISVVFFVVLLRRWWARSRQGGAGAATHLAWWSFGVFAYGMGTALESWATLFGNSIPLTLTWFIWGALLGGYPLAQGSVFLIFGKGAGRMYAALMIPLIVAASIGVLRAPVDAEALLPHKPSVDVVGAMWVRMPTVIIINSYAGLFLIGGAIYSAWRYARHTETRQRMTGNILIAIGALLPAIGGSMARGGIVEGLYIGELAGICLIWAGYALCVRTPVESRVDAHHPSGYEPSR